MFNDLNPKAVTNDELYGIINPATREWKDGLFSTLMRDQANLTTEGMIHIYKIFKYFGVLIRLCVRGNERNTRFVLSRARELYF